MCVIGWLCGAAAMPEVARPPHTAHTARDSMHVCRRDGMLWNGRLYGRVWPGMAGSRQGHAVHTWFMRPCRECAGGAFETAHDHLWNARYEQTSHQNAATHHAPPFPRLSAFSLLAIANRPSSRRMITSGSTVPPVSSSSRRIRRPASGENGSASRRCAQMSAANTARDPRGPPARPVRSAPRAHPLVRALARTLALDVGVVDGGVVAEMAKRQRPRRERDRRDAQVVFLQIGVDCTRWPCQRRGPMQALRSKNHPGPTMSDAGRRPAGRDGHAYLVQQRLHNLDLHA